ncbi:MAG: PilZ domain-containing protein [Lachnospiraceae bacterium]|nr:PilZ domain-containing protein [Lachnospiraceae bacterium]
MRIDEIKEGQKLTLLVNINDEQLTFETVAEQSMINKSIVLAKVLYVDGKIVTFKSTNLTVDLVITPEEEPPQIFKNVTITLVKKFDGSLSYSINSVVSSKTYNRRNNFRCFVGIPTTVQKMLNTVPYDAVIKDVSAGGFSIVVPQELQYEKDQVIHVVLNDYIEETCEKFSFHLYGLVVREEELDKGRTLYGCKFNKPVAGIENYIMKKERVRLKKTSGR